ncbi:GyrI-like domain-containing protein [Geomonas agri]|uniref:GyrI-like domain-containing protein n=1 Tax=Geomonas agri TaxID=2873702 RepID=UPI001CD19566|nr:GyrI-like domain-containing protein [Geomonas agri]
MSRREQKVEVNVGKMDFLNKLKHLYGPSAKKVEIVDVPGMNFLMVDGEGDPNTSQAFKDAVEVLFSLSYTLKFMLKKGELGIDYGVLPLEALWWSDDPFAFTAGKKELWKWTVMVMQPDFITPALVDAATKEVQRKKKLASLSLARFEAFKEGKAAQTLHIGPFTEEGPTIEKVHSFIESGGSQKTGKHHEIYLSDMRRAVPEKWKTIIRQPMS